MKGWLLNHTKSNNLVPRLSRHTVPTNLTPPAESQSSLSTAQRWWEGTRRYSGPFGSVTSRRDSVLCLPLWALGSSPSEACRAHAKGRRPSLPPPPRSPRDDKQGAARKAEKKGKEKHQHHRSAETETATSSEVKCGRRRDLCLEPPASQVVLRLTPRASRC